MKTRLPETTQKPILQVDATPDEDYPLRILRAYRANCDVKWQQVAGEPNELLDTMNEDQDRRAEILDKAIAILEGAKGKTLEEMRRTLIEAIYTEDGLDGADGVYMLSSVNIMLGLNATDNNPPQILQK